METRFKTQNTKTYVHGPELREIAVIGILLVVARRVLGLSVVSGELLDSIRVTQRVERVVARAHAGADHGDHARLGLLADERVAQHLRQLARAKRKVGALAAQRADALFQRQQRLVDLRAFHPCEPHSFCQGVSPLGHQSAVTNPGNKTLVWEPLAAPQQELQ